MSFLNQIFSGLRQYGSAEGRHARALKSFLTPKLTELSGNKNLPPEAKRAYLDDFFKQLNLVKPKYPSSESDSVVLFRQILVLSPQLSETEAEKQPPAEVQEAAAEGAAPAFRRDAASEAKNEQVYRATRDLLKDSLVGIEEVESAFTLGDGTKLIEFTPAERALALQLLADKVNEPDIQEFLKVTPKEKLANWFLILRVPKFRDKTTVTMKTLYERLNSDMIPKGQGKLLYAVDWYASEDFYVKDAIKGLHWQLFSRFVVTETRGKQFTPQTGLLKEAAQAAHLDPNKVRRRTPTEVIYDFSVILRTKVIRVLENEYDWTETRAADNQPVHIGSCVAGGAFVRSCHPANSHGNMGATLSR